MKPEERVIPDYLNLIRDNDRGLRLLVDAMDDLDLWKNTVVVLTADHGEMAGSHGGLRGKGPFAYELNSHIPLLITHPAHAGGKTVTTLTSHLDLLPTFVGMTGLPEARRQAAVRGLPGRDFSELLGNFHANRPGVLFNYVGLQTIDGNYLLAANKDVFGGKPLPSLAKMHPDLTKRGFMSFVFDGRYKFARYYAPPRSILRKRLIRSSSTTTSSFSISARIPTSCITSLWSATNTKTRSCG
jgi:hypothetical protein